MPLKSEEALVIGSYVFNEQDKIVHLLTSRKGIQKIVAPGSSKGKNRFGSLLELFTEGEFFFYSKEDRELATLSKGDIITSYFDTVSEPDRIFHFYLIAEIVMKFVPSNFNTERIYKLIKSILNSSKEGTDMKYLILYFMVWILRIEGLMFEAGKCLKCNSSHNIKMWVMPDFRGVVCEKCRNGEDLLLEKTGVDFFEWTKKRSASEIFKPISTGEYKKIFRILKNKIEYHGEFNMNSARYLVDLN